MRGGFVEKRRGKRKGDYGYQPKCLAEGCAWKDKWFTSKRDATKSFFAHAAEKHFEITEEPVTIEVKPVGRS